MRLEIKIKFTVFGLIFGICIKSFSFTGEMFIKLREYHAMYGTRYVVKIFKRRILHLSNEKDVEVSSSYFNSRKGEYSALLS